jgi:hypothetical protein
MAIAAAVYDEELREEGGRAVPLEVSGQAEYIRSKNTTGALV